MMRLMLLLAVLAGFVSFYSPVYADQRNDPREQTLSDTLDLWREGRFEQMYERLSHRTGLTREQFVNQMRDAGVRPSCCFQKLTEFRVINDKRTTSKVFARIGMEGATAANESRSREFTLDHEEGIWKMRLADIKAMAGLTAKKSRKASTKKYYH
jgi:hypothetical protein